MKLMILIFVSFLFSSISYCQEWKYSGISSSQGDKYYLCSKYVTKMERTDGKNVIKIWIRTVFKTFKSKTKIYYNGHSLQQWRFDCENKNYCLYELIFYDSSGSEIETDTVDNEEWDEPVPDSIAELLSDKVCELYNK